MREWPDALRARIEAHTAQYRLQPALAARWIALAATDAEAVADLADRLRLGENHLRDVLDWAEEIAARDESSIAQVLRAKTVSAALARDLGRNDAIKAVREALRRLRFPRLVAAEEELERRVRDLRLPANVRLVLPPDLRDAELRLEIRAGDAETLRAAIEALARCDFRGLFEVPPLKGEC